MTSPGGDERAGSTLPLDSDQLRGLDALLELSARLGDAGVSDDELASFTRLGDLISEHACVLAGLSAVSVSDETERLAVLVTLQTRTPDLWDCHLRAPRDKAEASYCEGPSRTVALASGLVLLARTLLDRGRGGVETPEVVFADGLEECMTSYEDNLEAVAEAKRDAEFEDDGEVD